MNLRLRKANAHAGRAPAFEFDCERLEARTLLTTIQILAAGVTGQEVIDLEVNGAVVGSYGNLGTGAFDAQFVTLEYSTADVISANDVRIAFTNDLYDPQANIDRNVRIDAILLDGVRFETEASNVFSTGTWLPADGVTPGFRQNEFLHTNGYFQYAGGLSGPGSVVINEIHYNPGPDGVSDPDAEFVELFNPGGEAFDLSGASFVGFDLTFAAGTSLGAGQYAIVSPSIAIAQAEWGVTPIAEFAAGGISGGGETIQLIAADGVTALDEVTYDDSSPWPGAPDGNGPSLELVNPSFDNSVASNWGVSTPGPTPGAQNSIFAEEPAADITDITVTPGTPLPNQAFSISATIPGATTATLTYKINFGVDQTVAMTNIGGDVWSADVPGQAAGDLVRYRIDSDVAMAPFDGDTINYLGVVVSPTDVVDNTLPVFHWFVDPAEFQNLIENLRFTNTKIEAVVAYGDQVIDNATVRIRGNFSRNFDKLGFKFEMPDGYLLDMTPLAATPVDEFGIVSDFADATFTSAQIAWEVWNAETDSQTSSFFTRVEQNGDFYGVYRFQELYDGTWRDANGHGDDQFFQAEGGWETSNGWDQKEPDEEDFTDIDAARDILTAPSSPSKTAWLYENANVPAMINHMAISALMRHGDQSSQNFYAAKDGETGRWEHVEWDLDLAWRDAYEIRGSGTPFTTVEAVENSFMDSIWEVQEFRDMYWRRLDTLVEKYLSDDGLMNRRAELIDEIGATNTALEADRWDRLDISVNQFLVDEWQLAIDGRRAAFANEPRLPSSTNNDPNIVINELHYNSAGDDAEFIELYNNSSLSVDLSGWTIDGIGLTIPTGTVILPRWYVVFTDNDFQFREQTTTSNVFVGGQYSGGLSGGGETITLFDASGDLIDTVSYDDVGPWPTSPDGDGFTLSLIDPDLDNSLASSWVASDQINGTPGRANNVSTNTTISIFAAGTSTNEIVGLDVNGIRVADFELSDFGANVGDYDARQFVELTWSTTQAIDAEDVRLNFVNDFYDPANGIDYNVKIDRIEINGVVYQTEDPNVFSTGTWLPADGVTPGFRQSEILHTNGYFQFDAAQAAVAFTAAPTAPVQANGSFGSTGADVLVALIDTGIDLDHSRLVANLWTNSLEIAGDGIDNDGNGYVDDVRGYDFVDRDANPDDLHGHGTFIAGVMGAAQNGTGLSGIASDMLLMPLRALGVNGTGYSGDVAEAIRYAVDNGAQVIALPIEIEYQPEIAAALEYAASFDVLIVAAAGNGGDESPNYVASQSAFYANILSAGALSHDGLLLTDSNRASDTAAVQLDASGRQFGNLPGEQFGTFQGTSIATGTLAGAAALVASANPALSAAQIREVLVSSATASVDGNSMGSLDAAAAVALSEQLAEVKVVMRGRTAKLYGSHLDDVFEIDVANSTASVNGVTLDILPTTSKFTVVGGGGNDVIRLQGTEAQDRVKWQAGRVQLATKGARVTATDFASVHVDTRGGNDTLQVKGSSGDDALVIGHASVVFATPAATLVATGVADAKVKGSRGNDLASIVETHVGSGAQNGHRVAWQQTDLSVNASQFSDFETMSTFELSQLDAAAWQTVGPYAQRVALELLASLDLDELF